MREVPSGLSLQLWSSLSFWSPLRPRQTYYCPLLSAQASFTQHLGSQSWRWSQCIFTCASLMSLDHSFSGYYSFNTYNFVSLLSYSFYKLWLVQFYLEISPHNSRPSLEYSCVAKLISKYMPSVFMFWKIRHILYSTLPHT